MYIYIYIYVYTHIYIYIYTYNDSTTAVCWTRSPLAHSDVSVSKREARIAEQESMEVRESTGVV